MFPQPFLLLIQNDEIIQKGANESHASKQKKAEMESLSLTVLIPAP